MNTVTRIRTPLARSEFKNFKALCPGLPVQGSLYYHYARLIEVIYAIKRVGELLDMPGILSKDIRTSPANPTAARGVGVIEAPRGTLIHDYTIDADGLLPRVVSGWTR